MNLTSLVFYCLYCLGDEETGIVAGMVGKISRKRQKKVRGVGGGMRGEEETLGKVTLSP